MSDAILEVDFGPPLGKQTFQTHQELLVWWEKERTFWNRILNDKAAHAAGDIRSFITQPLNQCDNNFREGAQLWTSEVAEKRPDALKNWMRNVKSLIEGHYLHGRFFLAESAKGQFLTSYFETRGALAATYAASFLLRPGHLNQPYLKQEAEFASFCFQEGLANRAEAEINALNEAKLKWNENREVFTNELKMERLQAAEWSGVQGGTLKDFKDEATASQVEFKTMMKDAREELAKIKVTYDKEFALNAPVSYWQEKSTYHEQKAQTFRRAALVSFVLTLSIMLGTAFMLLVYPIFKNPDWKPEVSNLLGVILIGSTLVWLMREVVKMWLSHVHLHHDAQFRITLMKTYLSLLRGEKEIKKEDHAALVAALYRPISDGIVKEDAIPLSSFEAISRGIGRP